MLALECLVLLLFVLLIVFPFFIRFRPCVFTLLSQVLPGLLHGLGHLPLCCLFTLRLGSHPTAVSIGLVAWAVSLGPPGPLLLLPILRRPLRHVAPSHGWLAASGHAVAVCFGGPGAWPLCCAVPSRWVVACGALGAIPCAFAVIRRVPVCRRSLGLVGRSALSWFVERSFVLHSRGHVGPRRTRLVLHWRLPCCLRRGQSCPL